MPRVPDYREPKPQPPRRSHEAQSHRQPYHTHQDAVYSRNSQINPYPDHDHDTIIYSPNRPVKPQYDESTSHSHPKRKIGTFTAHLVASAGEFVGTFMFLYFSFAGQIMLTTQADPAPNGLASSQQNIFTALLYGFSLLINVWAFYRISGGLFNPAVTFGLVLSGAVPPLRGLFLFPAQLIAAMCAAAVVQAMVPGDVAATNTSLSPSTSVVQGVFIEMFMTAELVFVVLMLAAEKSKDTFIAPVGIGLALFVAMMGGKNSCFLLVI